MGLGVDLIRDENPEHAAAIDTFKEQLLLVLIRRLGGDVHIPVAEVDDTAGFMLMLSITEDKDPHAGKSFHFQLKKKS